MLVTRGYGRKSPTQRGGVISTFGYGLVNLGTILRMKVSTRENRRKVGARVEGKDI